MDTSVFLQTHGLRDTQPRRLVLDALSRFGKPATAQALHERMAKTGKTVNVVTVYRVLEALHAKNLIHEHPCNGGYSLCTRPQSPGHHGFLHCTSCDRIEEFQDSRLCTLEDKIASDHRFSPSGHVSEILGTCRSCS